MNKEDNKPQNNKSNNYPPVVSVLGHVDHGKTTLLDAIRKTDIAGREKGGITQKIGASEVEVVHEGKKRKITFIDTPGHEAFSNMRSRGVSAADIVLLIVASDDGVMPQTKESIKKILEAKVPFIVVMTKVDLESANIERVKQQLLKEQVMLEGLGGDIPYIGISAKSGEKIHDLLDLILLVYDLLDMTKDENQNFYGIVIESRLDKKRGNTVTLVVKNGILKQGDKLFTHKEVGKIRALLNYQGQNLKKVLPGQAVEILGAYEIIPVGSIVYNKLVQKEPVGIIDSKESLQSSIRNIKDLFAEENKTLKIILKTQGQGELEAIKNSLTRDTDIVFEGQGDINISDVLLAKDFGAIILGFGIDITKEAKTLAESEHVYYKIYHIIYELLDEIEDAIEALVQEGKEVILGKASIIASFEGKDTKILGIRINEGRIAMNDKVRLMRGQKQLGEAKITTLKRGKQDVKEVAKNLECGVSITPFIDFSPGDAIISYK